MNEEEAKKIIDNMSEQELNDFIFFALQEVEKENQKLKTEIENKDKEISKLKNNNKDLLRKLRKRVKQVKKLQKYSLYKKEFSRLNKQLQNKDKIIDLMSEQLVGLAIFNIDKDETLILSDKEEVKQYYENKAKE